MEQEVLQQRIEKFSEWRPTDRQADFLQIPHDVFEVLYGGALGGGKSEVLLVAPIVLKTINSHRQLYEHPEFTGIIFRRTYPQLEKSLIPRAKILYEPLGAKYNETKKVFTFPSGAKIFLGHMDKESDVFQHDTNEYQYVGIDQAEQFTEFQLRYISSRIRRSNPDLPTLFRLAANPGGESHTFLRDRFVKPNPIGNIVLLDKVTGLKRMYIPAKLADNPYLTINDPDYVNRLNLLPESERAAKMDGDWFTFAGQVFSEFRMKPFPNEPPNAQHVIEPFTIPIYWPKILGVDWGYSADTAAIWAAISPEGRIFIYRTYKKKKTSVRTWATELSNLSKYDGPIIRNPLDPSAWVNRGQLTIAQEYQEASGFFPEKADNDRHSGISLIHEYLRFNPLPPKKVPETGFKLETANYILRTQGLEGYNRYLDLFTPEEKEGNIPILQIFNTERSLIEAIQTCQYDDKDLEDVKEWNGDDFFDCLRYTLKASRIYLEESKRAQKLLKIQENIEQKLSQTGDMHSYYMQMDKLDSDRRNSTPKAVRRYH